MVGETIDEQFGFNMSVEKKIVNLWRKKSFFFTYFLFNFLLAFCFLFNNFIFIVILFLFVFILGTSQKILNIFV